MESIAITMWEEKTTYPFIAEYKFSATKFIFVMAGDCTFDCFNFQFWPLI